MAYQRHGKEARFRSISSGQQAVNQQLVRDKEVIRNIERSRDQAEKRDADLIQGLRHANRVVDENRQANQRLEDKAYRTRKESIDRNIQRSKENLNVELGNIERDAKIWEGLSETAVAVLTKYGEHRKEKHQAELDEHFANNPTDGLVEYNGDATVEAKARSIAADKDEQAVKSNLPATYLEGLEQNPILKSWHYKQRVLEQNIKHGTWQVFAQRGLNQSGKLTPSEVRAELQKLRLQYIHQMGLKPGAKILAKLDQHISQINFQILKNTDNNWKYLRGKYKTNEAKESYKTSPWHLKPINFRTWQTHLRSSTNKEGVRNGNAGYKSGMIAVFSDPTQVTDQDLATMLTFDTLDTEKKDGTLIPGSAKPWGKFLTKEELDGIYEAREAKKNATHDENVKNQKVRDQELYPKYEQILLTEWDNSEKGLIKILGKAASENLSLKYVNELEAVALEKLAFNDRLQTLTIAQNKIKTGTFYLEDWNRLPRDLQEYHPEWRKQAESAVNFIADTGWTDTKVNSIVRDTIVEQLQLKGLGLDPKYNRTIRPAIAEGVKDFRVLAQHYYSEAGGRLSAIEARDKAWATVSAAIVEGKGKWERQTDDYQGSERIIGTDNLPYFDPLSKNPPAITIGDDPHSLDRYLNHDYIQEIKNNVDNGKLIPQDQDLTDKACAEGKTPTQCLKDAGVENIKENLHGQLIIKAQETSTVNNRCVNNAYNIRTLGDAVRVAATIENSRLPGTEPYCVKLAGSLGLPLATDNTLETLASTTGGMNLLTQFYDPITRRWRNGARKISPNCVQLPDDRCLILNGV